MKTTSARGRLNNLNLVLNLAQLWSKISIILLYLLNIGPLLSLFEKCPNTDQKETLYLDTFRTVFLFDKYSWTRCSTGKLNLRAFSLGVKSTWLMQLDTLDKLLIFTFLILVKDTFKTLFGQPHWLSRGDFRKSLIYEQT